MEEIKLKQERSTSFVSANSANGFFSLYEKTFDVHEFDRIFVLAGGPGTGKSTLMRRIADAATELGAHCEEILCSSDPASVDGLILSMGKKRVGVLDGTPPHPRIITAPGCIEELFSFDRFWDAAGLSSQNAVITALGERKKLAYRSAYHYLAALGSLQMEEHHSQARYFDKDKAIRQIRHKTHPLHNGGRHTVRFLRAFSTIGEFILPFTHPSPENVLLVSGKESSAEMYLSLFSEILQEKCVAFTEYLSPLCPNFTEGIYIPQIKTLLIKEALYHGNARTRRIVADRFFSDAAVRKKERSDTAVELMKCALTALSGAGKAHAAIEEIYKAKMDFDALQAEGKRLCARVLSALAV